ncbi:MarR family transcriptional regulator [Paenibacillus sp. HB172176]|uniref:MarR family winged helix-turn-helix transcriptional regulator n=1 Tax=Paenibacillus sp. HB172176 TaxID=2493690 RepID=UPI0014396B7D|nr:MarR family transcriptional regulator [Paenibacillus sp. HB172176]
MADRLELEQFVDHMQRINRYLRSEAFDKNKQEITRVQWMLMRKLKCSRDGVTIGQLAEHLDVRASTMSQMLDRLEKLDYVARKGSEEDARVKLVQLTEAGRALITQMEAAWLESLEEPFAHFSETERQQLVSLMTKLSNHLPRKGE